MEQAGDYYDTLGLPRAATLADVRSAYRKLALKHHPHKQTASSDIDSLAFESICEAYWVLGDVARRAVYDQYGYEALRDGIYLETGEKRGGEVYPRNGFALFEAFFGTDNPFYDFGFGGRPPHMEARLKTPPARKMPPILRSLECSLEELYNGCVKRFEVTRKRRKCVGVISDDWSDPRDYDDETKTLTILVKPGWKAGTKITFACEGDEGPHIVPADIVFEVKELPHSTLKRNGFTLIFTASISLADALSGTIVHVPTLDGRILSVSCPEVVSPGYGKTVPGEGMPVPSQADTKGDLVIQFHIAFPKFVTDQQKLQLRKILSEMEPQF